MYEKAQLAFENYMKNYDLTNPLISLKYKHTYKVVELMSELSFRLNLNKEDMILAKVIGLLHDIGRFEQIKEYNIISDKKTNMDHAEYGYQYLFLEHHIKYKIDTNLMKRELLFTKMIRDMDKVDIFRVLALKNNEVFKASEVTEGVLKEFSLEHSIDNNTVKTDTDKVLLVLAFIFDINFEESFDILVNTDNFDFYLSMVEVALDSEKLWKKVREICFDKINRGLEK